jgi:hypothetical protein
MCLPARTPCYAQIQFSPLDPYSRRATTPPTTAITAPVLATFAPAAPWYGVLVAVLVAITKLPDSLDVAEAADDSEEVSVLSVVEP